MVSPLSITSFRSFSFFLLLFYFIFLYAHAHPVPFLSVTAIVSVGRLAHPIFLVCPRDPCVISFKFPPRDYLYMSPLTSNYMHTLHAHTQLQIYYIHICILETLYDFNKTSGVAMSPRPHTTIDS